MTVKTASLVLGSGGARGLAHIGVIDCIKNMGLDIRCVAGSSMGALIGGIYAAGKLDVYRNWVCALTRGDVLRLLDFSFAWSGLFKGERIIGLLRQLIGECNIEDLPIPYTAVATDLATGREFWFTRGPLFNAIRASMALPTIFTPYEHEGRKLVDGGLSNPVPIAPTRSILSDITIAVDLGGRQETAIETAACPPEPENTFEQYRRAVVKFVNELHPTASDNAPRTLGLFEVVNSALEMMQGTVARLKLAADMPDALIEIPKNACGTMDFYRAREMIALGYRKASEVFAERSDSQ
ncbi:MAG TPA: patatin-like phospholipase family protein [Gammaproteobacteria bacterium]|nr:patatin-like phospholipase family protein [Gammaproteobacteria bacterium]